MLIWLRRLPHASTNRITKRPTTPSLNWVSGIATTSYECVSCAIIFHGILNAINNFQFVPIPEVDPRHRDMSLDHPLSRKGADLGRTRQHSPDKTECQKTGMFLRYLCQTSAHLLQVLLCNGYRCAISGVYDMQSCLNIDEIDAASKALDSPMIVETGHPHLFRECSRW